MTAAPVAMTAAMTQASKNVRKLVIPFMASAANYRPVLAAIKRQIVALHHPWRATAVHIVTEPCRG
jgi:hypothetical protein